MEENRSPRELLHELGNALQEKVALQYLLGVAASQIEELSSHLPEGEIKDEALSSAQRFRRAAEL